MLQRFLESLDAIKIITNLEMTEDEIECIKTVCDILGCFRDIIYFISSSTNSISFVIPFLNNLLDTLENYQEENHNKPLLRKLIKYLCDDINERFKTIEDNESLIIASILDPRFKD